MKKSKKEWYPTKFQRRGNVWSAGPGYPMRSRLVANLQVAAYEQALGVYARGRLADLGCGNAPLCGIYGPLVDTYVWVDWPGSSHQLFKLDLEHDLNEPIPLDSASFDTIVLSDVLEHIAEPDLLVAEIARLLRPGGVVIIGVPFLYWIHEEPHDHHRYTRYKLQQLAQKWGLSAVEIKEVGGALDAWADLTGKLLSLLWSPLAAFPYYGWRSIRAVGPIRRLNESVAWRFPLAYLAVFKKNAANQ